MKFRHLIVGVIVLVGALIYLAPELIQSIP